MAMGLWYYETFNDQVRFGLKVKQTLHSAQSEFQHVEVIDTFAMGKVLAIDNVYMTSEGDEFYYHEMISHPALVTTKHPERVLIIGGGDGGTAREVLRHPAVKEVVLVEIDREVIRACKQHLPSLGNWDDARLTVRIEDGIRYVREAEEDSFDVVLLDGTDPRGPAKGLFDESFYKSVHRVLKSSGVFALQSESPIFLLDVFKAIQLALRRVFRKVHPYFGPVPLYSTGIWSWTFATDSIDPMELDLNRAAQIEASTRYYNRSIHKSAFALPNHLARDLK